MHKEILLEMHMNNLMWLLLGSCISADSNTINEERAKNIGLMEDLLMLFKEDDIAKAIEPKTLEGYETRCREGIKILKDEIEQNQ